MTFEKISSMLGLKFHPLSEDGTIARIESPYTFSDGDKIPVFLEVQPDRFRFFDDGLGVMYFLQNEGNLDNFRRYSQRDGVTLSCDGEFQVWATEKDAPSVFAQYIAGMIALEKWDSRRMSPIEPVMQSQA